MSGLPQTAQACARARVLHAFARPNGYALTIARLSDKPIYRDWNCTSALGGAFAAPEAAIHVFSTYLTCLQPLVRLEAAV